MIPRIYNENFTEYDSNGLGLLKDIIECTVDEELNGDFELVFKYPVKGFLFEYLQRENIIKADASNSLKGQLFRIYNITKAFDGIVTVYAKHITHDLVNYSLNEDINQENANCENAGNYMLSKSDAPNKFQIHSNVDMLGNYKLDRKNDCMSAIIGVRGSLIDTYGNGAKILKNNFDISILKRRGSDNNVLIAYAKNLTGFELIEDTSDMITRIKPYATYSPQQTESETDNTNEEKTIYLDEIYVDSDRIDKYQTIKSKWIDFSEKFENTTPTREKLKLYANAYFADNNCDIPKLTYKIEFQPLSYTEEYKEYKILEDISMDDGVCIFNKKYGIKDEVRVIKTKYDVLKERYISIELGDPRTTFKDLVSESKDGKDGIDGQDGKDGLNGADGVNGEDGTSIIWKGSFDTHPSNPENGWAYYNINDKKSYVYQDGAWYQMTIDGQDGIDGNNGADGLSIAWKGELTSPPENPQENWVYKDTDNGIVYIYTGTAWEVMTYDGSNGADGAKGDDGNGVYITYNDSIIQPDLPTGNGTTNGWHTDCTENVVWMSQKISASSTEGEWGTPVRIKGEKGDQGEKGADGTSVSILGSYQTYDDLITTHPNNNSPGDGYMVGNDLYVWNGSSFINVGRIKGEDGQDGQTPYVHIKYSNDGETFTSNNGETPGSWMGIYTDFNSTDSNVFSSYTWKKIEGQQGIQGIQGEKGDQGIPGNDGTDGKTTYFHIKYSNVENPTTSSQMTETPSTYIGTYVDYDSEDSTDPSKYTWHRFEGIQGEKGDQGIPGNNGADGKTTYLHIKYSNDGGETFTSNNGEDVGDYIGTCTDFNSTDPTDVSSYKWAKIKGNDGLNGKDGKDGDLSDFPDDLPSVPTLKVVRAGFKSISLSWNFVNKPHYNYELYASQTKDFTPTEYDLIFKGMGSAYLHEVECSQTWYYKIRAVNIYNSATNFSNQVNATTAKINDASTYFENAAIGSALIGSLNADVINTGKVKGAYIDAKNLTVTDGNGKTTLSVDDTGNVAIKPTTFDLKTTNLTLSSTSEIFEMKHEDGSYTRISPGGFMLYQASTGNKYKCLVSTGYFSITGKGTSVITLPSKFDNIEYWDIDIFYSIETNWGASSSMVDKTCIYEMYANDIFQIGMEKDSNGHWTKKVDYSLKDVCVKAGASMQIGDIGNMNGFVHWIALA